MIGRSNNLRFVDAVGHFGFSGWWGVAGGAALQAVSECPRHRQAGITSFFHEKGEKGGKLIDDNDSHIWHWGTVKKFPIDTSKIAISWISVAISPLILDIPNMIVVIILDDLVKGGEELSVKIITMQNNTLVSMCSWFKLEADDHNCSCLMGKTETLIYCSPSLYIWSCC